MITEEKIDPTQQVKHLPYELTDYKFSTELYDREVTSRELMDAQMAKFYYTEIETNRRDAWRTPEMSFDDAIEFWYIAAMIQQLVNTFEAMVWYPHMQKMVDASKRSGMKAELDGLDVLVYTCAGRTMITLQKDDYYSFTLITAEGETPHRREDVITRDKMGPMGYQSIYGSANMAREMVEKVIAAIHTGKFNLKDDNEVGII
jgi:hypothetical protein